MIYELLLIMIVFYSSYDSSRCYLSRQIEEGDCLELTLLWERVARGWMASKYCPFSINCIFFGILVRTRNIPIPTEIFSKLIKEISIEHFTRICFVLRANHVDSKY